MRLYAKDNITGILSGMADKDHFSHAVMFTGAAGSGRKTAALITASYLMCENRKEPCLTRDIPPENMCRHCRRILEGTHPDVIIPERNGKSMIYKVETIRDAVSDAYVMPNDCDKKLYIFPDSENIQKQSQNTLLKIIEEPPDMCYFVFTAQSREALLPTMLSRLVSIPVHSPSEEDCLSELIARGTDRQAAENAVSVFHGNIGKCLEYLSNDDIKANVIAAQSFMNAMTASNEYEMLRSLASVGESRDRLKSVLTLCLDILRDGLAIRTGSGVLSGCSREISEKIASGFSYQRMTAVYDSFFSVLGYIEINANVSAAAALITADTVR